MEIKNEVMIVDERTLKDKIYIIRGQQVMLDFELAEIYGYSTKRFNEQVKNNIDKFDSDFMFQLSKDEWNRILKWKFSISSLKSENDNLISQNVISSPNDSEEILRSKKSTSRLELDSNNLMSKKSTSSWGGSRYLPFAFTEQGIYMLMTVLRGEIAIKQSKALIRLFKSMKDYIVSKMEYPPIDKFNEIVIKTYENSDAIDDIRRQMVTHNQLNTFIKIFDDKKQEELLILDGQPFKADLAYKKIFNKAKKNIIIIDDYIGIKTIEHLRDIKENIKITIYTDNKHKHLSHNELTDFYKEYPKIKLSFKKTNDLIHDRFIIIDYNTKDEAAYHLGSSIKDTGNKITMINRFVDSKLLKPVIDKLKDNEDKII